MNDLLESMLDDGIEFEASGNSRRKTEQAAAKQVLNRLRESAN